MNKLNKTALLLAVACSGLLGGCAKTEYSSEMTEPAVVEDTIFMPSQHGSGTGISVKGTMSFTSVDIPEKYAVVFQCQHGKFVIEGKQDKHKEMWQRLKRGQKVTIRYREQYRVDGASRALVKYDFLGAD